MRLREIFCLLLTKWQQGPIRWENICNVIITNPQTMPSGYMLRLYLQATRSGYALRLHTQAIPSGYTLRLCPQATHSGYTFRLHTQATPSGCTLRLRPQATRSSYMLRLQVQTTGSDPGGLVTTNPRLPTYHPIVTNSTVTCKASPGRTSTYQKLHKCFTTKVKHVNLADRFP